MEAEQAKLAMARTAVVVACLLASVKLVVAWLTLSVSVMASCLDSLMDAMVSFLNMLSIRVAGQPPDDDHGFGHEKAESIAALFQFVLIGGSALGIAAFAVLRMWRGEPVQQPATGMWTMLGTTIVSWLLSSRMRATAKSTGSVALGADSLHYATDVWTNLGVVAALALVGSTGAQWVDGVCSLLIASFILKAVVQPLREAIDVLMDRELNDDERARIVALIETHDPRVRGFHKLRTRRSGSRRFVEFHLVIESAVTFQEAHDITETLVDRIRAEVPSSWVIAHTDPHTAPYEDD